MGEYRDSCLVGSSVVNTLHRHLPLQFKPWHVLTPLHTPTHRRPLAVWTLPMTVPDGGLECHSDEHLHQKEQKESEDSAGP